MKKQEIKETLEQADSFYKEGKKEEAFAMYLELAEAGDAESQGMVGSM